MTPRGGQEVQGAQVLKRMIERRQGGRLRLGLGREKRAGFLNNADVRNEEDEAAFLAELINASYMCEGEDSATIIALSNSLNATARPGRALWLWRVACRALSAIPMRSRSSKWSWKRHVLSIRARSRLVR